METRVGISFFNTMGNLIFLSAAVKVLRNWGYQNIDLITDLKSPGITKNQRNVLIDLGSKIFDKVLDKADCKIENYQKIYSCGFSKVPHFGKDVKTINWKETGIHEILLYLNMIGATWNDFDGYIFPISESPILPEKKSLRIGLANAHGTEQAKKKSWSKFPELSKQLIKMGFETVLVGLDGELEGCEFTYDYRGKCSIYETAKVIQQCDVMIATSTGLGIISDVVKTPLVMIDGPMPVTKFHPIQTNFTNVRKYISCAPCAYTQLWNYCTSIRCMDLIQPKDVIESLIKFLPKMGEPRCIETLVSTRDSYKPSKKEILLKRSIAYMVSVKDRFEMTKNFFESFKDSKPLPGSLFILNDNSNDPRILEYLNKLKIKDIDIVIKNADISKVKYNVDSIHCCNELIKMARDSKIDFDYYLFQDSDAIFKQYWIQKMILQYEEVSKSQKLWGVSGFNNSLNDKYFPDSTSTDIYENEFGKYRLRGSLLFNILIPKEIFNGDFGTYNPLAHSSDLSKSEEMINKGYCGLITIPSLVEHIGAYSSLLRFGSVGTTSSDF